MTQTTQEKEKNTSLNKEKFKVLMQQVLSLDPILATNLAPKMKKNIHRIYLAFLGVLAFMTLMAMVSLFTNGPLTFMLNIVFITVSAICIRMCCEYVNKD